MAVIVAVGVNSDGRREVLGMDIGLRSRDVLDGGPAQAGTSRAQGVKLVISDAPEGLKAAVAGVLTATWQRCRAHFMRNALAHAGRSGRRVVSALSQPPSRRTTPRPHASNGAALPTSSGRRCRNLPC